MEIGIFIRIDIQHQDLTTLIMMDIGEIMIGGRCSSYLAYELYLTCIFVSSFL